MIDKNGIFRYSDVRFVKINNNQNNVVIYPNPTENDEISIYFIDSKNNSNNNSNSNTQNINIFITNILGQKAYENSLNNENITSKNIKISTKNWSKGVYIIKIIISNTLVIKKVEIK